MPFDDWPYIYMARLNKEIPTPWNGRCEEILKSVEVDGVTVSIWIIHGRMPEEAGTRLYAYR